MPLADDTRLEYNSVTPEIYSSSIRAEPRYDESGRTVTGVKHVLSVRMLVHNLASEDAERELEAIRRRLSKNGGILRFHSKGYGDLIVNADGVYDSDYGPKVTMWDWTPVGDQLAAFVNWQCETIIPECPGAKYQASILALNFATTLDFDQDGYATIRTAGYLEIPAHRKVNSTTISDHVRLYMEGIRTTVPFGFQRISQHTPEDYSKRRLDFDFTDQQIPYPLAPFMTRNGLRHEMNTDLSRGFRIWHMTLSGPITLAAGVAKSYGYAVFMAALNQRLDMLQSASTNPPAPPAGANPLFAWIQQIVQSLGKPNRRGLAWALVDQFRVSDEVTGRSTDYHARVRVMVSGPLGDLLANSGMWQPLPAVTRPGVATWERWRQSMDVTVNRIRGMIHYEAEQKNDVIVDLCTNKVGGKPRPDPKPPAAPKKINEDFRMREVRLRVEWDDPDPADPPASDPAAPFIQSWWADLVRKVRGAVNVLGVSDTDLPDPERSWVGYICEVLYAEDGPGRFARHKPMGGTTSDPTRRENSTGSVVTLQRGLTTTPASALTNTADVLHEVRSPSARVYLQGRAVRMGHRIPVPELIEVGGVPARLNRTIFYRQAAVSRHGTIPIYACAWKLEYLLEKPPEQPTPTAANPLLGLPGLT